ncbi:uncharacterized protein LOC126801746 isoform X2 [Argentina anserina]|uniref:uncharacterized protein LOC126801746 isoform X2 n=1 Tax=Argentina anserina TaxID=57926 RepID=UPI0021762C35|nr:uncharacterized protein LOC126801746 isoform X2 [Potentilla anserina]
MAGRSEMRSSLHALNAVMFECNKKLAKNDLLEVEKHLARTPFWSIIKKCQLLTPAQCRKKDSDFQLMIGLYKEEERGFLFPNGSLHRIKEQQVVDILGLNLEGEIYNLSSHSTRPGNNLLIDDCFPNEKSLHVAEVKSALTNALETDPVNHYRIACLIVMFLFATFLFCETGSGLKWSLVAACTDLEEMSKYSWGKMTLEYLLAQLGKHAKDKDTKDMGTRSETQKVAVSGCMPLVMYWLADQIQIQDAAIAKHKDQTPTFVRWQLNKLHLDKLTNEQIEGMFPHITEDVSEAAPPEKSLEAELAKLSIETVQKNDETNLVGGVDNQVLDNLRNKIEHATEELKGLNETILKKTISACDKTKENKIVSLERENKVLKKMLEGANQELELLRSTLEDVSKEKEFLKTLAATAESWKFWDNNLYTAIS